MIGNSIRYSFVQRFRVPAVDAYRWSTSYDPDDLSLMGEHGIRSVKRITDDALLLSDAYVQGRTKVKKTKLVRLSPDRLSWTSTHITGPNRYSQFQYRISPEGRGASHLEFTGLHIEYTEGKMPQEQLEWLTRRTLEEDSAAWKLLAKEMEKDLLQNDRR
jgi:hypothetical protein